MTWSGYQKQPAVTGEIQHVFHFQNDLSIKHRPSYSAGRHTVAVALAA